MKLRRSRFVVLFLVGGVALAGVSACKRKIGDQCNTNADCSSLGDRFCDTSAPCGSCTVESCDVLADINGVLTDSCPTESTCVRFFEAEPDKPCDPHALSGQPDSCALNERCLCDYGSLADLNPAALATEDPLACGQASDVRGDPTDPKPPKIGTKPLSTGQPASAHCAPESSERRWCQYWCNGQRDSDHGDSDCRLSEGFHCVQVGTFGSEYVERMLVVQSLPDGGTRSTAVGVDPMPNNQPQHFFCLCTDPTLCYPTNTTCGIPRTALPDMAPGSPDMPAMSVDGAAASDGATH